MATTVKINRDRKTEVRLIRMSDLRPSQAAIIREGADVYNGHLVMRTLSENNFEVVDLDDFAAGESWTEADSGTDEILCEEVDIKINIEVL